MRAPRRRSDTDSGFIYSRPDGKFWWMSYLFQGQRVKQSTKETDKRKAESVLRTRLVEIAAGKYAGPDADFLKLGDLKEVLQIHYESNGRRSWDRAARSMDAVINTLGDVRVKDVTTSMLEHYWDTRKTRKRSDSTTRQELVLLHKAWVTAVRKGKLSGASVPMLPHMPVSNTRRRWATEKEFRSVLANLPEGGLQDVYEFLGVTGWRKNEALGLRWKDVDTREKVITLTGERSKNGEQRELPYANHPEVEALIARRELATKELRLSRPGNAPVEYVFSRDGGPIRAYDYHYKKACEAAEVVDLHTHDLRRKVARELTRDGVPQRIAQAMLGHKTASMFVRYDIIEREDIAEGVRIAAAARAARNQ
jgi:integrase